MNNKNSKDSHINIKVKGKEAVDKRSFLFSLYVIKERVDHNSRHYFKSIIHTRFSLYCIIFRHALI